MTAELKISALFNLALLLADDNRSLEAEPFLSQLVRSHPDHVKGLILLGDIYINHLKDLSAAEKVFETRHKSFLKSFQSSDSIHSAIDESCNWNRIIFKDCTICALSTWNESNY